MTAEAKGRIPPACGKCRSGQVQPHCDSPSCTWARCRPCGTITWAGSKIGFIRVRTISGPAGYPGDKAP